MKAKKKQNIANQMSSESNEWYTPGYILRSVDLSWVRLT